jgi:hypothetical protein
MQSKESADKIIGKNIYCFIVYVFVYYNDKVVI